MVFCQFNLQASVTELKWVEEKFFSLYNIKTCIVVFQLCLSDD